MQIYILTLREIYYTRLANAFRIVEDILKAKQISCHSVFVFFVFWYNILIVNDIIWHHAYFCIRSHANVLAESAIALSTWTCCCSQSVSSMILCLSVSRMSLAENGLCTYVLPSYIYCICALRVFTHYRLAFFWIVKHIPHLLYAIFLCISWIPVWMR